MARLTITFADLYTKVSNFLALTDTGTAPTSTNLTTCKDIVYRGLRQFLYPIDARSGDLHNWSFLKPYYVINLFSGKWKYQLPADFSEMLTEPAYSDDSSYSKMTRITPTEMQNLRAGGVVNYTPYYYAIVSTSHDNEIGSVDELWLYPEPDSSYEINFFYKADPLKPESSTDYLPGGVKATEAIIESCLAIAEQDEDDGQGTYPLHTNLYAQKIQELIIADTKKENNNVILGNLYEKDNGYRLTIGQNSTIDYSNLTD